MAEQTQGIGGQSPRPAPKVNQDELRKQEAERQQKLMTKLLKGEDKVTLEQTDDTTPTYGPIPGDGVGTPYELLRSLVINTLHEQGAATQIDTGSEILDLQQLSPEEAQQLVSEDGYFGVDKTSQRIVDFAINAFGNDPTRLEEMKAAIEDGFQHAADVFGGQLPEISHQTYDAIMEKLASFAEEQQDGVDG